ncbi:MAG: tRNA (guanosine-2'-O-)-methyltransferase [Roseivirga sp.]
MQAELINLLEEFVTKNKVHLINKVLAERTRHFAVVLEDVYHPHNASAVLRTSDCFGLQDLYITQKLHEYQLNPNIVRGASNWVTLHKYEREEESTIKCFQDLRKKNYRIVGTTPDPNSASIHDLDISQKTAVVFGAEHEGISDFAKQEADELVHVPMYGFTESFNVSVSVALIVMDLVRRLKQSDINWRLTEEEQQDLKFEWYQRIVKRSDIHIKTYLKERSITDIG